MRNTFRNKTNNDVHEAELDDPPFHKLRPETEKGNEKRKKGKRIMQTKTELI